MITYIIKKVKHYKMSKFLKKLLIEITLFISMVALAGHVTVNFWERYVVQDKLSHMKESLDHLKVTVNNMGYAYDDLQRDLIELAGINSKLASPKPPTKQTSPYKEGGLSERVLEHLNNMYTKVSQGNNDKACHVKQLIADKNTATAHISKVAFIKNAATITRFPLKATAVGPETEATSHKRYGDKECIYKCRAVRNVHNCYADCEKMP